MPCCFVFVHDAFADHFVDQRHGIRQRGTGSTGVFGRNGCIDAFDIRAHHGTLRRILGAPFFCLSGAFSRLCTVSQKVLQQGVQNFEGGNMPFE